MTHGPVRDRIPLAWRHAVAAFFQEWALAVILGVAALIACAKLGEDVFAHETASFDEAIQVWVVGHQNGVISSVFLAITYMGSVGADVAAALVAAIWLWRVRGRRVAAAALVAPTVATVLFLLIKRTFARMRPAGLGGLMLRTYSFPSGHSTASTAVWCTLAYVTWREGLTRRRAAIWIAVVPPLLVGISRVYLDVHWATDVLGGWSLGLLLAVMGGVLYDRNHHHRAALGDAPVTAPAS